MARPKVRIILLCEDQRHAHFVIKLCEQLGHQPVRVVIAPKGTGSAEQWVRKNYAQEVKRLRGHGDELVGLVVVVDGDRFGVAQRKQSLADSLQDGQYEPRKDGERIVLLVPTWSVETWFAWLCDLPSDSEAIQYKKDSSFNDAWKRGQISPTKAADAYRLGQRDGEQQAVPSLADGRAEMQRLAQ